MSGTPESPAPLRMAGPDEITVRIRRLPDGRVAVQYRERFDPSRFTPAEWGSIVGSAARADRVVLPALRTYGLEARMAPWEARGGPWQGEWVGWDAEGPHDAVILALANEIVLMQRREVVLPL